MSKRYRILFVDDEVRILRSLNSLFKKDYDVLLATSGKQALEILSHISVDVIVSDQRMPHMTGDQLLEQVHLKYPQVMRILLTGYVDKQAIVRTINEGEVFRFISKPWNRQEIKEIIAEAAEASNYHIPVVSSAPVASLGRGSDKAIPMSRRRKGVSAEHFEDVSVLLLDPDESIRYAVRSVSRKSGFTLYGVSSYRQVIRCLAIRESIGVAIIGIEFGAQQTIEILNVIKQQRPDLSVIVLAEMTDGNVAIDLINKGQVFRYLQKPIDGHQLERAVVSAIKRHKMLRQLDTLNNRYKVETSSKPVSSHLQRLRRLFKKSA